MSGRTVAFNGKFLASSPSGVHRVAEALITGVDHILAAEPTDHAWEVLKPRDARGLDLSRMDVRTIGRLTWQPWEQFELPWHARGKLLVNLCNLAPLAGHGAITMIHDAQVFISPESYSTAFKTWYQFALPRIGATAGRILTVSEYSRQMLARYGVARLENIEVVHNGVDHLGEVAADMRVFSRLDLDPGSYVVTLANTQAHKNVGMLFHAMRAPDAAGLKLVMVGSHTAQDFEAAGHTPPANVIFAGRVSDEELAALYGSAICLAFPSTTEGFGLPPLEAMRAGCPAVVAPCGALPEVCGEAAIYVDPFEPEAWAKALRRLREDSGERTRLIKAGYDQAAKFTWAKSSRRLMEIIDKVLRER